MRYIHAEENVPIAIGRLGENISTSVVFDIEADKKEYPNATFALLHRRAKDPAAYPVSSEYITFDEKKMYWLIQSGDLTYRGNGLCEYIVTEGETILKSAYYTTYVDDALDGSGNPPDPWATWVQQVLAAAETVEQAVAHMPTIVNGNWYMWNAETGEYEDSGVQAEGHDGYSPTVTVEVIEGGHRITITDASGPHTFDVMDGTAGTNMDVIAPAYEALSYPVLKGQHCIHDNGYYEANVDIPTAEEWTPGHWTSLTVGDELAQVKTDIAQLPNGATSNASDVDLDVTDENGNVIVRLQNGHIKTKNFDSADMSIIHNISGTDYIKQFTYDASESTTQTIQQDFKQGDIILCHVSNVADDVTDRLYTTLVTYKYIGTDDQQYTLGQEYGYNFPRYTLPADAKGIVVVCPSGLMGTGTYTFKFIVYKLSDYKRQPHIITVGADGKRMFTSIRAAMDSFHDNNAYNTYEIWVWPGTYNILSDYTAEEISAEDFVGLWVKNGVKIKGIGHREQIILHGELSTSDYNLTKRNAVSTLNMSGNSGLENLTVTNRYMRYAVHDDHGSGYYQEQTRIIENCKFKSIDSSSSGNGQSAYGAGGHNNKKLIIRNCDLGQRFIIHNTQHMYNGMTAVVENCFAQIVSLTDNNDPTFTARTRIEFINCNFDYIRHDLTTDGSDPTMILQGVGTHDVKLDCEAGILYNFGDCRLFLTTISAGQAVKMNNAQSIVATTSLDDIYGISIGNDGTYTYVQRRGYINNNTLGLTNLSVGDYITINSSGVCVSGGTSENAIGIVECIDATTGTAFIKLLF